MAEPETQTEDETTSEFLEEIKTDTTGTDVTEDATTESDDEIVSKYKNTESETNEDDKKKRFWLDNGYAESRLKPEKKNERKTTPLGRLPDAEAAERKFPLHEYFPLAGLQLQRSATRTAVGLDRRGRSRIWRNTRARQSTMLRRTRRMPRSRNGRLWSRFMEDAAIGLETRKRRGNVFPYDPPDDDDEDELLLREQKIRKELDHVRAPISRPESRRVEKLLVDRAVGKRRNLVDGDYVLIEVPSKRVYANVILHGLKGMRLLEMNSLRERKNTWKFCFYQAVVALLAKTQFRYKRAWSVNIDYIYDHAWMLFTHIGTINVKARQCLDDLVVYNYKYNVEIELIQEMKNVAARNVDIAYKENGFYWNEFGKLSRKDPLQVRVEFGCQKEPDTGYLSVHNDARKLEKCLKDLTARYRECILRTARFSLAFWQDGVFWYLYNPYRCDVYGFWNDDGYACIVKFCTADSLRRHLMILLLRGHAYETYLRDDDVSDVHDENVCFDVQIFHVSFHCCQLDNPKSLQRDVSKQPRRVDSPSDSPEIEEREDEADEREKDEEGARREPRERATWLRRCRATWSKCAPASQKTPDSAEVAAAAKARWHQYYVEEPNRLFSLWGEIHITDDMFEANRGMQAYACYVVCAGMIMLTAPEYWSPKTLDAIVVYGDRYYTRGRREAELESVSDAGANRSFKYLSDRFEIGEIRFEARLLPAVRGRLYGESNECLWRTLERVFSNYRFAALTCESACLGLYKFRDAYYMCDVNSFGPPLFRYGHGVAYLLRATSFRKFVTVLVLTVGSPERSRFSLNPIEILEIVEMDTAPESRAKTRERGRRFERFVEKMSRILPRFAKDFDGQRKTRRRKKSRKSERNIIACNNQT